MELIEKLASPLTVKEYIVYEAHLYDESFVKLQYSGPLQIWNLANSNTIFTLFFGVH